MNVETLTKTTKVHPVDDRVLVRRDEAASMTAGGIALPDVARDAPARGRVVAVGPGRLLENGARDVPAYVAGDRVLFKGYAGTELEIEGVSHLILGAADVLGIVE